MAYEDVGESEQVLLLPCDLPNWPVVRGLYTDLSRVKHTSDLLLVLDKLHQAVYGQLGQPFEGLAIFLESIAEGRERDRFFEIILPSIVRRASDINSVKPEEGLRFCEKQKASVTYLDRKFIASLLASAFLCTIPEQNKYCRKSINFSRFFRVLIGHNKRKHCQAAKLRCFLQYFEKLSADPTGPEGVLTFHRQVLSGLQLPDMDDWLISNCSLCPLTIKTSGGIEDSGSQMLHVDFANSNIGGGVLRSGAVQEEILFSTCPELVSSMLFMDKMKDNEAIFISGFHRFSSHQGYGNNLTFNGEFIEKNDSAMENVMSAIDAIPFSQTAKKKNQYKARSILRELNKAYLGFRVPDWPRFGYKEVTPGYLETSSKLVTVSSMISEFCSKLADQLVSETLSSEILISKPELAPSPSYISGSNLSPSSEAEVRRRYMSSGAAYWLEAEKHPSSSAYWLDYDRLAYLRRRSSSEVSSRFSSRKPSSDISSDFDQFYEGHDMLRFTCPTIEELRLIQSSISEEEISFMQSPHLEEFAQDLVSQITKAGLVQVTSTHCGIQNFDTMGPAEESQMAKPIARRHPSLVDQNANFSNLFANSQLEEGKEEPPTPAPIQSVANKLLNGVLRSVVQPPPPPSVPSQSHQSPSLPDYCLSLSQSILQGAYQDLSHCPPRVSPHPPSPVASSPSWIAQENKFNIFVDLLSWRIFRDAQREFADKIGGKSLLDNSLSPSTTQSTSESPQLQAFAQNMVQHITCQATHSYTHTASSGSLTSDLLTSQLSASSIAFDNRSQSIEDIAEKMLRSVMPHGDNGGRHPGNCYRSGRSSVGQFADSKSSRIMKTALLTSAMGIDELFGRRSDHQKGVATGNWGCGAYGGDPHLKSLIQWLAASAVGAPQMLYYVFGDERMNQFKCIIEAIQIRQWKICDLAKMVLDLSKRLIDEDAEEQTLFDIILSELGSNHTSTIAV